MSLCGLILSDKEKNLITATLYNIIKNERRESPATVKNKWKLFFRGYLASGTRASNYLYWVSNHRPLLCKMVSFLCSMNEITLDNFQSRIEIIGWETELDHFGVNHILGRY